MLSLAALRDLGEQETRFERIKEREYDACNLAWVPELESDPEQLWHSSLAPTGMRSSNHPGVADARVDELLAQGGDLRLHIGGAAGLGQGDEG